MGEAAIRETLPGVVDPEPYRVWFGRAGCVEAHEDSTFAVYSSGELLGTYHASDVVSRDLLIAVVLQRDVRREDIALAFRVSPATVGRVVTRFGRGGFEAVAETGGHGGRSVRTPKLTRLVAEQFAKGVGPRAAHRAVAKLASYGTVQDLHKQWLAKQAAARPTVAMRQEALPLAAANDTAEPTAEPSAPLEKIEKQEPPDPLANGILGDVADAPYLGIDAERAELTLDEVATKANGQFVQHLGSWLMVATVNALGVHRLAARYRQVPLRDCALRTAIDAALIALTLGQKCMEGVRRLQTPTLTTLLRCARSVSASWVRSVLAQFAQGGSMMLQATMAATLLRRVNGGDERVVLYVDNHLRPYSGKHVLRKGWRMQEKRAVAGTSDFYVHDETGSPLWRINSPSHGSLCAWLLPVVEFARLALGELVKPLLVFDRGGAFVQTMADLRDADAEFVTYERRPYPTLADHAYDQSMTIQLASRPQTPIVVRYAEGPKKNLRGGRGRVRRIAMLMEDGYRINLLAISKLPAEALIRYQLARWGRQENQFKHGVERWGINHLDGRRVQPYPSDAIIPNPARTQLERRLRLARTAEGEARRRLARLDDDSPHREQALREIAITMERQTDLVALRAQLPTQAPVSETPLAGKLRFHEGEYKSVIDTLRVALANAESDLAVLLAEHLRRPREAKKILANLFAAPGTLHVGKRRVTVRLLPAASTHERAAFQGFLQDVNKLGLVLPGDHSQRPLRFQMLK